MIINKIRLQEAHPMTVAEPLKQFPLPLVDFNLDSSAGENGYTLKVSTGLDPPDMYEIVDGFDVAGVPLINRMSEKREIDLRIGLTPRMGQSYGHLRDTLYKLLTRSVVISLMHDSQVIANAAGYVSRCQAVHFANQPDIQLTVACDQGEFLGPQSIMIPVADWNVGLGIPAAINYEEGTAPTGLELIFTYTAAYDGFTIVSMDARYFNDVQVYNSFGIDFPFIIGDMVIINTQLGKRRLSLIRSGVESDLSGYIFAGAVWPMLRPGVNIFFCNMTAFTWNSATYIPRYWGV